jgi:hypothetical protein
VERGRPGVTAVYQAMIPEPVRGTDSVPLDEEAGVRKPVHDRGTDSVPLQGGLGVRICPTQEVGTDDCQPETPPRGGLPDVAPAGADADAPRHEGVEELDDGDVCARAPAGVPSRSEAEKPAARNLWCRYDALIRESNSDAQVEVASCFVALLRSSDLRSPIGFLERILRDHEHLDVREVGSVLAHRLSELAERHHADVVWFDDEWRVCSSCWTWRFACACPVADVWPSVEAMFSGLASDVMNELAWAVDAVVEVEGAAAVAGKLPSPAVVENIRRDGREEEAARLLTDRLRKVASRTEVRS